MQQIIINVPKDYPKDRLAAKAKEIEQELRAEVQALHESKAWQEIDPWDALDIEAVAVDTGRTDGSIRHDHYIYGTPKP